MRFLANENFPLASVHRLREAGHEVVAITEISAGAQDVVVLDRAAREDHILMTFDRDYGELIYRRHLPPPRGVIYLRVVPETPEEAASIVLALLRLPGLRLEGRYTVVERERIRQRPLPFH
jgi:predicted nuclease of predicted toxin-antitoxin system